MGARWVYTLEDLEIFPQDEKERAGLILNIARQLYRREHGSPPASSRELVGHYLDRLPDVAPEVIEYLDQMEDATPEVSEQPSAPR
jgi:hypothetical protein